MNDNKKLFSLYKKFIKKNIARYKKKIALATLLGIFFASLTLLTPFISKIIIDDVILKHNVLLLKKIVIVLCIIFISNSIVNIIYNFILIVYSDRILTNIKLDFYKHIISLPYSFFHEKKTGETSYRLFDDVNVMYNAVIGIPVTFIVNFFIVITIGLALFLLHWKLALIITVLYFIQGVFMYFFLKPIRNKAKVWKYYEELIRGKSVEHFSNIYLIKVSSLETIKRLEYFKNLRKLFTIRIEFGKKTKLSEVFISSSGNLILYTILAIGTIEIFNFNMTIGGLVAFLNLATLAYKPASGIFEIFIDLQEIIVSMKRFFEIYSLNNEEQSVSHDLIKYKSKFQGAINILNISFRYNEKTNVFNNFNLNITKGEKIAIIGNTGIGKTTICNLILGLYKVDSGVIKIDNVDIKDWDLKYFRRQIGVVAQNSFVLSGTILSNINIYDKNIKWEDIEKAAMNAHILDYIHSLKDGFYTEIGERGIKISGGEAQRIAIARVFLQNPRLIIWDEPTSFLDKETEEEILDSFVKLTKDKTCIIVTHKPAFLSRVDRVIDLNQYKQ